MKAEVLLGVLAPVLLAGRALFGGELEGAGKTLRLMHIQVAPVTRKAVEDAVKRFEAATGARVTCEALRNDQFKQKIAVELGSDSPPDVFHSWGGGGLEGYVARGLVEPIPGGPLAEGIGQQVLEFCQVGGRLYAVPADVSIVVFWYRKSLFEKHGIRPPVSLAGLYEACARLNEAGVTPVSLGNAAHWPGAFYFDYFVLRLGGARDYVRASNESGRPALGPRAKVAASLTRAFVDLEAFPEGFNGLDYNESQAALFRGDAAMTLMGSWLLSYAISDRPEVVSDLGLFPFPPVEAGADSNALLGGVNAAYAISSKSKHKELAAKLVGFLTDEVAAREWVKTGRIPARRVDLAGVPAVLADAAKLVESAPRIQLYFDQALSPAVAEEHKPYTHSLFAAEKPRLWPRLLVGTVAVAVLVIVALVLRTAFASGERG